MAVIEGVGDEVTALFGLLAALLVLALAWFSTRTAGAHSSAQQASSPQEEPPGGQAVVDPGRDGEEAGEQSPDGQGGAGPSAGLRHRAHPSPAPQEPSTTTTTTATTTTPTLPPGPEPRGGGAFVLRLKFLNDTERLARVRPEDTVGALKRAQFPGQEQLVRLIFQGQLLGDDTQTLGALQLSDRSVLHCYISSQRHRAEQQPQGGGPRSHLGHSPALQVGSLMMPLFVLMLGALWYFQLQYRHLFTATATACLAGLTLLFSAMAFAVYRR
ncbi:transmembrane and ubiquitin-like domain-containing protein 1 [Anolis carolinensis]|uniref:Transmembrane and ubiquitin-like domain-containing protein 1 n=1 Tax=Anolis carolinensis TaxID=28377 RepID=H9G6Y4_ANOCA|nr:PREDICTED: transmembrane and ubiquitin-like domain-containing protein 1 [Anolis carolinensis]|eukprot:XP_003230808.1 PREDICTED: transmembrane and ubiquitin-like domain-containing protein 1 [Anolis carolinensis]